MTTLKFLSPINLNIIQKCRSSKYQKIKLIKATKKPIVPNTTVIYGCPPIWDILPGDLNLPENARVSDIPGKSRFEKYAWTPPSLFYTKYFGLDVYVCEISDAIVTNYDQNHQRKYAENLLQALLNRNPQNRFIFHCIDEHGFAIFRHCNDILKETKQEDKIFGCVLQEVQGFWKWSRFLINRQNVEKFGKNSWTWSYLKKENGNFPLLFMLKPYFWPSILSVIKLKERQNKSRPVREVILPWSLRFGAFSQLLVREIDEILIQGTVDAKKKKKDIPPFIGRAK